MSRSSDLKVAQKGLYLLRLLAPVIKRFIDEHIKRTNPFYINQPLLALAETISDLFPSDVQRPDDGSLTGSASSETFIFCSNLGWKY